MGYDKNCTNAPRLTQITRYSILGRPMHADFMLALFFGSVVIQNLRLQAAAGSVTAAATALYCSGRVWHTHMPTIAQRIMQTQGWSGTTGLGKHQQGMINPVKAASVEVKVG